MMNRREVLIGIGILILLVPMVMVTVQAQEDVNQTVGPTVAGVQTVIDKEKDGKFRVGPTVKIRPLSDVINKSSDGIIELYFDNPELNDVTLNVDARINVPSGIHVYGDGFAQAAAAGTVYGTFSVPPGTVRTIYVNIKADKTGDFFAHLSGIYYPGSNKDEYQPISLSHPFRVSEPSPDPSSSKLTNPDQVPSGDGTAGKLMWIVITAAVAGLIGLGYKLLENRLVKK